MVIVGLLYFPLHYQYPAWSGLMYRHNYVFKLRHGKWHWKEFNISPEKNHIRRIMETGKDIFCKVPEYHGHYRFTHTKKRKQFLYSFSFPNFLPLFIKKWIHRVACPKFEHPALSSEFYNYTPNTEFVAAVGILWKKSNYHLNLGRIAACPISK